jgi:hypothetical protein
MKRTVLYWIIAVVITLVSLVYQRITGPTYPVSGTSLLGSASIPYKLIRSYDGQDNAPVEVKTGDPSISGTLIWKRYKTDDPWTQLPLTYHDGVLTGGLPHQPVAGKLMYRVELERGGQGISIPGNDPIIIRFRNPVPTWVVIPHVCAMFCAFLFAARAGLEFFNKEPRFKRYIFSTIGFLILGGLVLGPVMQYYSFNLWWTGWPLGTDLTDNKTAVAFLAWVVAAIAVARAKNPKYWALGASVIMIVVYLIPHSMFGSELDYKKVDQENATTVSPE